MNYDYNGVMPEQVLKGEAISWCGTKVIVEVRLGENGKMYFQKLDTELPKKKEYLRRIRDACIKKLEEL